MRILRTRVVSHIDIKSMCTVPSGTMHMLFVCIQG